MSASVSVVWGIIYNFHCSHVIPPPPLSHLSTLHLVPYPLRISPPFSRLIVILDIILFILVSKIYCHTFYQLLEIYLILCTF